jgi:flavodoxin
MRKALVIYHSKTGITRAFGKEISDFLSRNNVESTFISINDYRDSDMQNVDYLFLGCWTSGLMILLQHPEKAWVDFSKRLPDLNGKKVGLFTTYTIATCFFFFCFLHFVEMFLFQKDSYVVVDGKHLRNPRHCR